MAGVDKYPLYFFACYIAGMEDAPFGMSSFLAEVELIFVFFIAQFAAGGEVSSYIYEFINCLRPRLNDFSDDIFLSEVGSGTHRIRHVVIEGVFVVNYAGDAALGVLRVTVVYGSFCDNGDGVSGLRETDCAGKPGNAAADYNVIKKQMTL